MSLLLDTHAFLWWLADDVRLSEPCRDRLAQPRTTAFVSAVSIWEIAIKVSIGKLTMRKKDLRQLSDLIALAGFKELPISARHSAGVLGLPNHHNDPFDRLLVAQALAETLTLVTSDRALVPYGVDLFRAD